jgi:hypothetical protein
LLSAALAEFPLQLKHHCPSATATSLCAAHRAAPRRLEIELIIYRLDVSMSISEQHTHRSMTRYCGYFWHSHYSIKHSANGLMPQVMKPDTFNAVTFLETLPSKANSISRHA